MKPFSVARLTAIFLRVGNLTFGGGDPTMMALHSELVDSRRWLANDTYGLVYALARITPGTNLLAFCAGVAWELAGWTAAILGVAAVTLPAAAVIMALTGAYDALRANGAAMAAIGGTLAAAVGMMGTGAWQLLRPQLRAGRWIRAITLASAAFALSFGLDLSPIQILALAALVGAFWQ